MTFTKGHPFYGDLSKPNYFQKGRKVSDAEKLLSSKRSKGNKYALGNKLSDEWKKKMSEFRKKNPVSTVFKKGDLVNEKNPLWRGENAGYVAKHVWVNAKLGKPDKCVHCQKDGLSGRKIHWANISGRYRRDLTDWIRLCAKCHYKFDKDKHIPWNKGKKCPQISERMIGRKLSKKHVENIRKSKIGTIPWNKGIKSL